jgi:hypothetical protein
MKKAIVLLVIVSLFTPSLGFSFPLNKYDLGPNAQCVYNCFQTAAIVAAWAAVLTGCFPLNSPASLSTSSSDGFRYAAPNGHPYGLGDNAWCVYNAMSAFYFFFWSCCQGCFLPDP